MTELAQRHLCHLVPLWCHFQAECLWTAVDVHDALRANGCEPLFVRVQRDSPGDGGGALVPPPRLPPGWREYLGW